MPTTRRHFLQQTGAAAVAAALPGGLALRGVHAAAAEPERIKIGQMGTAHAHAAGKMETLRKFSEHYEVVGVVEPDPERRRALENEPPYRGLKWLSEEQLLQTPGLAAVAVETEVRDLLPTAARCVAAGMHIHLDKPAGESLAAFRKVLDDASRRGLVVQMGYMFRYNPAFLFLFDAVRKGWLGEVFELHGVMSKTLDSGARRELAQYPGGTMFELGCHLIDALVAVLGIPEKVIPYARRTRTPEDDLADNQLAVFEYPRATATIRSALVEVEGFRRRQFVVCGTEGTIDIKPLEPPSLQLALSQPRGDYRRGYQEVPLPIPRGRYDGDFLDLFQVIRGEKEFGYPPEHDLAVQEAVLRASGLEVN